MLTGFAFSSLLIVVSYRWSGWKEKEILDGSRGESTGPTCPVYAKSAQFVALSRIIPSPECPTTTNVLECFRVPKEP